MSKEVEPVRRFVLRINFAITILATVALVSTLGLSLEAIALFVLIWLAIILTAAVTALRMARTVDLKVCGKVAIQGMWFCMSLSLSYLIMTPAPYFRIPLTNIVISALIGVIILAIGAYSLLRIKKQTGVMISI